MKPRRRFGQHFLRDKTVLRDIVAAVGVRPGERVVEIGPGDGALTAELLRNGARVSAVEIDRDLCAKLRTRFADEMRAGQLALTEGDALRVNWHEPRDRAADGPLRVAGNFPYNISTPLLLRLRTAGAADIHAMLQREVAERLRAAPGAAEYGRLTVAMAVAYKTEALFAVAPAAFYPPPKVASTFVRLTRRTTDGTNGWEKWEGREGWEGWEEVLRRAFASRRKTLANALRGMEVDWAACGIDPSRRAQTLAPEEFFRLAGCAKPKVVR